MTHEIVAAKHVAIADKVFWGYGWGHRKPTWMRVCSVQTKLGSDGRPWIVIGVCSGTSTTWKHPDEAVAVRRFPKAEQPQ